MIIFPAIDLFDGKAIRLLKGDYDKMTIYENDASVKAKQFEDAGASYLHMVDLNGARSGEASNFDVISSIVSKTKLSVQIGGGIRSEDTVKKYLDAGAERVILGTAALENRDFLSDMVSKYDKAIAVGVDIKDGLVAVRGWTQTSDTGFMDFISDLSSLGVKTVICTDISKDGAMQGTNRELYASLSGEFDINIIASGGVSTIDDVTALKSMGLYGAILGRALYVGGIDLAEAVKAAL